MIFNSKEKTLNKVSNQKNRVPPKRYKHSFCRHPEKNIGYLSGGLTRDGPVNDIYEVDLTNFKFKKLNVRHQGTEYLRPFYHHTSHVFLMNG